MKISLKSALALVTAVIASQLNVQMSAADARVEAAKTAGDRAVPVVIAEKAPFTAQDVAKYQQLEAGSRTLRAAGADDDVESCLIIGVALAVVGGVVLYGQLYVHSGVNGMGGGGY